MTAPRTAVAQFTVKGVVDYCTVCECCGRTNLKRTVALMPLDCEGNEEGQVSYYGTQCAADALRWTTTKVTNAARLANREHQERDDWARRIISVFGPVEYATLREQAAAWFSRNPHSKGLASEEIGDLLARARTQLTDTALGAIRPHTMAEFMPHWVVQDGEKVHHTVAVLPDQDAARESTRAATRALRGRGAHGATVRTVYALDAQSAAEVAHSLNARARYEERFSAQA
ncbi:MULTISPECIES: hypothetical protein [unclassified Streptomyces]|uniref:hypothetical protein n=1 Tax=unclassified Streptomyces TaxID=2593676 RepID=UPI0033ECE21D